MVDQWSSNPKVVGRVPPKPELFFSDYFARTAGNCTCKLTITCTVLEINLDLYLAKVFTVIFFEPLLKDALKKD